jgi:predicted nucleic acid-binding Zn ribbon protein
MRDTGPQSLADVLTKLIALRGFARKQGSAQLQAAWAEVAGPEWSGRTRATGIKRGVLQVSVAQAPLLSELVAFHRLSLLAKLKDQHAHLRIRDIKFRLESGLGET